MYDKLDAKLQTIPMQQQNESFFNLFCLLVYETIFQKKESWKEMDRKDLPKFFRDCGRFPTQKEINIATTLLLQGKRFVH